MKSLLRGARIYYIAYACGITLCCLFIWYLMRQHTVVVLFDALIPTRMHKVIDPLIVQHTPRVQSMYDHVKSVYPALQSINSLRTRPHITEIFVHAMKPALSVRKNGFVTHIITHDGSVVPLSHFKSSYCENLYTVSLPASAQEDEFKYECYALLKIAPDLFERYEITWYAATEIIFSSRDHKLSIVADTRRLDNKQLFLEAERLFEADQKKYKRGMKADIRFYGSIICAPARGDR